MSVRRVVVAAGMLLVTAAPLAAEQRRAVSWSTREATYRVSYEGDIEFTADERDVKSISPGGFLKLSAGSWFGRGVDFRADAAGHITRRYRVSIVEKPFEPDGREWLARMLPAFIRESGIGARARVARIRQSAGVPGVLAEISRIQGSWGKRAYFTELLRSGPLDTATVLAVLQQAGREMRSDYELASFLTSVRHLVTDDATRRAFFEAAATIDSDYELASLLVAFAKHQSIDAASQPGYFMALDTVHSDFERQRVLTALAARADLTDELVAAMLRSAARIESDHEAAQFLQRVARQRPIDGVIRVPFFTAVGGVGSSYERSQVLQAVARHPYTPAETIVSVIRAAADMDSAYERSQVLLAVASGQPLSPAARGAYIAAADRLGEYEQGQVLTALVRNERGRR